MAPLPQPGHQLPVLRRLRADRDATSPARDLARSSRAGAPASQPEHLTAAMAAGCVLILAGLVLAVTQTRPGAGSCSGRPAVAENLITCYTVIHDDRDGVCRRRSRQRIAAPPSRPGVSGREGASRH